MAEKKIGKVNHFFDRISVASIKLDSGLKVGDRVRFQSGTNSFEQDISEMQVEHEFLQKATKGQEIGLKVVSPVKKGDQVFLL